MSIIKFIVLILLLGISSDVYYHIVNKYEYINNIHIIFDHIIYNIFINLLCIDLFGYYNFMIIIVNGIVCFFIVYFILYILHNRYNRNDIKYNVDDLIGMNGVIVSEYDDMSHYLGKLDNNDDIVVLIDGGCKKDDMFEITSIDGYNIIGRIIN